MILISISLMIGDIEHLFLCYWPSVLSFLEKCLFKSIAHFSNDFFIVVDQASLSSG